MAFLRLILICFVLLSIVYVILSLMARAAARRRLEAEWQDEGQPGKREDFVDAGLRDYQGSLRRKLLLAVYVIPVVAAMVIMYLVNIA